MNTEHRNGITEILRDDPLETAVLTYTQQKILEGQVDEGMGELIPALQAWHNKAKANEWAEFIQCCLRHPLRELLHQDPFTYRAFSKPRGYAGDAKLLDYIYGRDEGWPAPEGTTVIGRSIFEFTTSSTACEGVRARRGFVADLLDRLAEEIPRPHVLSIAAGHLREALLSAAVKRRKIGRFVALDSDLESLEEIHRCYASYGVQPVPGRIRHLVAQQAELGQFDFVYSTGLFDYLALAAAQSLTWAMFQTLRPRGRLLVANFLPGIRDVGYMESYMGWKLIFRTRQEMLELSQEIPQAEIRDIRIFAEENQNIIFLQVTKR